MLDEADEAMDHSDWEVVPRPATEVLARRSAPSISLRRTEVDESVGARMSRLDRDRRDET